MPPSKALPERRLAQIQEALGESEKPFASLIKLTSPSSSPMSGVVVEVRVKEGQEVKASTLR